VVQDVMKHCRLLRMPELRWSLFVLTLLWEQGKEQRPFSAAKIFIDKKLTCFAA
jgi:hypothetical protein